MTNKEYIQEKISKLTNENTAYETQVSYIAITNAYHFINILYNFLKDEEMAKVVNITQTADGAVLVICFPKAYISLVFKITDTTIFVLLMGPNKEHLIDKFDVTREFSFSTYAVPMIIGEIRRFIRDDGMIHVSRHVKDNARRIAMVKEELKKTKNHDPTIEELVEATGLSIDEILIAMEATTEVESIYQPVGRQSDGSQLVLADQLEDSYTGETDLINRITVLQMLETLKTRERRLIELRYLEGKTQSESAKELGMNQVAVSRLEKKILLFLRQQF